MTAPICVAAAVVVALYCFVRFWLLPWLFESGVLGGAVFGKERYKEARRQSQSVREAFGTARAMVQEEERQRLIAEDRERSVRTGVPMAVFEACRREYPLYLIEDVKMRRSRGVTVYEVHGASNLGVDLEGNSVDADRFVRSYSADGRLVG